MSVSELQQSVGDVVASLDRSLPGYVGYVYALVLVWGLGDVVSTYFAVSLVGIGNEVNPWMRVLLETEPMLMVAVKAAVVLYAGVVLLECRSVVETVPGWRVWFSAVVALGWLVTVNNLAVGFAAVA